jgi:GntR family transcriptional regulator/MocR family aminotransferase
MAAHARSAGTGCVPLCALGPPRRPLLAAPAGPDLSYGDPQGFLPLREALAAYLGAARGVVCNAHQIVIAPGAQAAISIATLALTDIGDRVWVENPGYDAAYRSLVLAGVAPVGIGVDAEGLDVDAGRQRAPDARLAMVSPSHQYPLGVTMSLARRLALAAMGQ